MARQRPSPMAITALVVGLVAVVLGIAVLWGSKIAQLMDTSAG